MDLLTCAAGINSTSVGSARLYAGIASLFVGGRGAGGERQSFRWNSTKFNSERVLLFFFFCVGVLRVDLEVRGGISRNVGRSFQL